MAFSSVNKMLLIFIFSSMAVICIQSIIDIAYAAEGGETVIRRVEIWGLFYRMMVAAFICWGCSPGFECLYFLEI